MNSSQKWLGNSLKSSKQHGDREQQPQDLWTTAVIYLDMRGAVKERTGTGEKNKKNIRINIGTKLVK